MKKIMIVDDSALMRRALSDIIKHTEEYTVSYTANNGAEALSMIDEKHDEIACVLCDIDMPQMNGLEFLTRLKHKHRNIPVIMVSASENPRAAVEAVRRGAVEFIGKPEHLFRDDNPEFRDELLTALGKATSDNYIAASPTTSIVRHSAEAPVRRERFVRTATTMNTHEKRHETTFQHLHRPGQGHEQAAPIVIEQAPRADSSKNVLVAVVVSTGGPKALQSVIPFLPANLAAPVVLVQHMPVGFTKSMADRLNEMSKVTVKEAEDGDRIEPGHVYIAKGGKHMRLRKSGKTSEIYFDDSPPVLGLKPCGNYMYDSLHDSDYDEIVCVVLTGMGADGTAGIKGLSKKKKIFVIAQDESSSTVYGMPKAIYEAGLTDVVCDLHKVASEIAKKVGVL